MECPHCKIVEVNCAIFRCGIYKQIPPHLSKECDAIVDKIYGCGKPFCLVNGKLEPCDYI